MRHRIPPDCSPARRLKGKNMDGQKNVHATLLLSKHFFAHIIRVGLGEGSKPRDPVIAPSAERAGSKQMPNELLALNHFNRLAGLQRRCSHQHDRLRAC